MARLVILLIVIPLSLLGCDDANRDSSSSPTSTSSPSEASSATPSASPTWSSAPMAPAGVRFDKQLHDELMAMFRRDQAGRSGGVDNEGDVVRTERLKEIITERGWPTIDLVGEDGADAAWAIVQHSDIDPEFQAAALDLLQAAAKAGQASWGNVAYLEDRVAVAKGAEQTYGTQITCTQNGAKVATPLADPERVERLRARAGLEPLHVYLAEMDRICESQPVGG